MSTDRQRGAALVEYALMLTVLFLGIGVGMGEFEDGVESDAIQTANDIAGDPGGATDSSTSSSSTTSGSSTSTTLPPPPVNQPPLVDVPDFTMVTVDPTESNPFLLQTLIGDDYTPIDLMAVSITVTSRLEWTGTFSIDGINDPPEWIETEHTAPQPGVHYVTVCAHDGLEEACDTGTVKATTGTVSVQTYVRVYDYKWNGSHWQWRVRPRFRVYDERGRRVRYDDVTVGYELVAVYDEGSGPQTVTLTSACNTGTNGTCWGPKTPYLPADAISVTVTVTDVTGICVDGWDGSGSVVLDPPLPPGPGSPPTTTTTTTTTTIPSSSTTTASTTSTTTTSTTSTTTPTTTTVVTTTTIDDDT